MKGIAKRIVSVILAVALVVTGFNYVPGPVAVKAATVEATESATVEMRTKAKTAFESRDGDLYNYVKCGVGVSATADPGYEDGKDAAKAIDGSVNNEDRWSNKNPNSGHWIEVDLKQSYSISKIGISWEVASSLNYRIEISNDGKKYEEVTVVTINNYQTAVNSGDNDYVDRIDQITFNESKTARYVKITDVGGKFIPALNNLSERRHGVSIWEIGIFGNRQISSGSCAEGTVESWELGSKTTGETFSDTVDGLNNYVRFSDVSAKVSSGAYPDSAIDNKANTRWENASSQDGNDITVDLCHSYPISRIFVCWETASASKYQIQVSNDGTKYTPVATLIDMPKAGGKADPDKRARTDKLTLHNEVYARYVRIYVESRTTYDGGTQFGSSIWEIGIYQKMRNS